MKLLIVDDQLATLRGLSKGIDWEAEGFHIVETAQNAMEARASFQRQPPDLMLCDIEMPVENGLQLCRWARSQNYPFRVIFLTCHSEFEYAKEAIELQASDYVLQPASYADIRKKVHKVVESFQAEKKKNVLQKLGATYEKKQNMIGSSLWRGFLMGAISSQNLPRLPELPNSSHPGYLMLLQVVRWTESAAPWEEELLVTALRSFVDDIFGPDCSCTIVAYMERNTYTIALQPKDEAALPQDDLYSRIIYLSDAYDLYMPCQVAIYPSELCAISAMPEMWRQLLIRRNENVTCERGIHTAASQPEDTVPYASRYRYWLSLWENHSADALEQDACDYLDQLSASKAMNARVLAEFYRDFNYFLAALDGMDSFVTSLLESPEGLQLGRDAIHSVEDMKKMIAYVIHHLQESSADEDGQSISQRIIAYVQENIWNDIRKEDIVSLIHMNTDYATRVFKKETGMTIKGYIVQEKLAAARQLLRTTSLSVSNVAVQVGYNNFSHFSSAYKKQFGISPSEERRGS